MKIEGDSIIYDCGCRFKIADHGPPLRLEFDLDWNNINFNCDATWDLICSGNSLGVFQFESRFGQQVLKKMKPRCIDHLAGLNAALRPGTLASKEDGVSLTDLYIERKLGIREVEYKIPALKPYLEKTYGVLLYQESQLSIIKGIAGFSEPESELFRKAVGKKKASGIAELKQKFFDGCQRVGIITREEARQIKEKDWLKPDIDDDKGYSE